MLAVGVDIIELDRIEHALHRWGDRFLKRVYTPGELAYCAGRVPSLAARWAAKEAVSKALGTGWRGIAWTELEVVRAPSGQPGIVLHGKARKRAEQLGLEHWALSISHSRQYAVAFVVAFTAE
ncbi:MAG TPA: holo-[acyl-carrier-protein] synthase [Anaerolineae bacterium]|nr:holo-[acyl-carrier-protein] synthase [Anaerolineae bacterium]